MYFSSSKVVDSNGAKFGNNLDLKRILHLKVANSVFGSLLAMKLLAVTERVLVVGREFLRVALLQDIPVGTIGYELFLLFVELLLLLLLIELEDAGIEGHVDGKEFLDEEEKHKSP